MSTTTLGNPNDRVVFWRRAVGDVNRHLASISGALGALRSIAIVTVGAAILLRMDGSGALTAEIGAGSEMGPFSFIVLPFRNTSNDLARDYIAAAVTSELTAGISSIEGGSVIAPSSALAIASQAIPVAELGRTFGMRFVLRGDTVIEGARAHEERQNPPRTARS